MSKSHKALILLTNGIVLALGLSLMPVSAQNPKPGQLGFGRTAAGVNVPILVGDDGTVITTGAGGGAPSNATYITKTPNGSLSAEQALSLLATGILKSTTTTGVVSIAASADVIDLWSGTCDATTFLRADGSCVAAGGGTPPVDFDGTGLAGSAKVLSIETNDTQYAVWMDDPDQASFGLLRFRNTNEQMVGAVYNPLYLKYQPTNAFGDPTEAYERQIFGQWNISDSSHPYIEIGSEWGPTQTLTSLTSVGTTATATKNGHGYRTGDVITVAGADQDEYNGDYTITVTNANVFTYTFAGSMTTPATGTITATGGKDRPIYFLGGNPFSPGFSAGGYSDAGYSLITRGGTRSAPTAITSGDGLGYVNWYAQTGATSADVQDLAFIGGFSTFDAFWGGYLELGWQSQVDGSGNHYVYIFTAADGLDSINTGGVDLANDGTQGLLIVRRDDNQAIGTVKASYQSRDGTVGVTVTTCTGFKDGLCVSGS